jgi:hypothetical protein
MASCNIITNELEVKTNQVHMTGGPYGLYAPSFSVLPTSL